MGGTDRAEDAPEEGRGDTHVSLHTDDPVYGDTEEGLESEWSSDDEPEEAGQAEADYGGSRPPIESETSSIHSGTRSIRSLRSTRSAHSARSRASIHRGKADLAALERANSIIGGESVGAHEQRVFNFTLPFNNPLGNLPHLPSLEGIQRPFRWLIPDVALEYRALQHDDAMSSGDEDREYSVAGKANPRAHALKTTMQGPLLRVSELPLVDGPVIVMGGYRGSVLRDATTGRRVWIPFRVGLRMRKINLQLGLRDRDERDACKHLRPGAVLSHIGPVDICRRLIRELERQPGCQVHEFGYDWRLSGDFNSAELLKFAKKIYTAQPEGERKGAIIIAHSMGGIIAHHAMQRAVRQCPGGQELIRGVVYAGSPSECPSILGPLRNGDAVLLAKHVLTPKTNFAMRSSFMFLPRDGRCFINGKDMQQEYELDFFDPETWIEYNLSPCVSRDPSIRRTQTAGDVDTLPFEFDEAVTYLKVQLERQKKFNDELEHIPGVEYPPLAMIYGNTLPTCRGVKVTSKDDIKHDNYMRFWYGGGDGVVFRRTLIPTSVGFKDVHKVTSKYGHVALLSDLNSVGDALEAILVKNGVKVPQRLVKPGPAAAAMKMARSAMRIQSPELFRAGTRAGTRTWDSLQKFYGRKRRDMRDMRVMPGFLYSAGHRKLGFTDWPMLHGPRVRTHPEPQLNGVRTRPADDSPDLESPSSVESTSDDVSTPRATETLTPQLLEPE